MPKKAAEKKAKQGQPEAAVATATASVSPASSSRWTFLTNHAHVLAMIHSHPEMVLREIALHVGITERAVQRIIQELEEAGFIEREKVGRRNTYEVQTDVPLRHPIEAHRNIGDLLDLVSDRPAELS
ncbi:MAG: MarR family transcriptional regulator [Planctomycetota bacterium]